jgi:hypothetical protein
MCFIAAQGARMICQTKSLSEKGVGQPFQAVQAGWKACLKTLDN